jgi:predicted ATP-dependent endonuclease of OLD family
VRIKSLSVKNFRSLQKLNIELPQVCALVGPNNSGKSNILEVIRRILGSEWGARLSQFSEDDVYLRDGDLDITIECTLDPPVPYRRLKNADPIEVHHLLFEYNRYKRGNSRASENLIRSASGPIARLSVS